MRSSRVVHSAIGQTRSARSMMPSHFPFPAMLAVVPAAFLAGCGSHPPTSPTSPAGGAPSVVGAWAGSYVVQCPDSPLCGTVGGPLPTSGTQPLSLVLNQTGNALSGQINLSGWLTRVADVSGTIALDGTMSLQGGSTWPAALNG